MPQPAEVEAAAKQLTDLYESAQERLDLLQAELLVEQAKLEAAGVDPNNFRLKGVKRQRRRALAMLTEVETILTQVEAQTGVWLSRTLPGIYQMGAIQSGVVFGQWTWTQVHTEAVRVLAQRTLDDVLEATTFMRSDAKRWIRATAKDLTSVQLIEGKGPREVARIFRRLSPGAIAESGLPVPIRSVVYRNGAQHTLNTYSNMLFKTVSAQTYSLGSLNVYAEAGITEVKMLDGADCGLTSHDDPEKVNGNTYPIETAYRHTLSHPNCQRAVAAAGIIPDNTEPSAAAAPPQPSQQSRSTQIGAESRSKPGTLRRSTFGDAQIFGSRQRKGRAIPTNKPPTAKAQRILDDGIDRAEELLAGVDDDRALGLFIQAADRVAEVQVSSSKWTVDQARRGMTAGSWAERPRRLAMETRYFDVDGYVRRVDDYNESTRALNARVRAGDSSVTAKDYLPRPSGAMTDRTADDMAGTFIHELTHVIDHAGARDLTKRIEADGIFSQVQEIYRSTDGDAKEFWYAATKPSEALPEITRMYFHGTSATGGSTGAVFRRQYPELAEWVEQNVFPALD